MIETHTGQSENLANVSNDADSGLGQGPLLLVPINPGGI